MITSLCQSRISVLKDAHEWYDECHTILKSRYSSKEYTLLQEAWAFIIRFIAALWLYKALLVAYKMALMDF